MTILDIMKKSLVKVKALLYADEGSEETVSLWDMSFMARGAVGTI